MDPQKFNLDNLFKIALATLVVVVLWASWSYIQTEAITSTTNLNGSEICGKPETLRYFKFLSFDERAGRAEIICLRQNNQDSSYHKINHKKDIYNDVWEITYSKKLNQDYSFSWPVYL